MLFPRRITEYASALKQGRNADIVQASIVCPCGGHAFKLRYDGTLSKKLFSPKTISCNDDGHLSLEAICTSCQEKIVLFDSSIDGYSARIEDIGLDKKSHKRSLDNYACSKCGEESQIVQIRIEYSGMDDVDAELILDDCFSWIWIDVECSKCKKRIPELVDMETA